MKYLSNNANANSITAVFSLGGGTNYPASSGLFYVLTLPYGNISTGNRKQLAFSYSSTTEQPIYTRYYNGTSWSEWVEASPVLTTTTLNADLGAAYSKWGRITNLRVVKYSYTLSSGNAITVGTLPTGYRPLAAIREANYQNNCYINIDSNGNVTITRIGSSSVTANLLFNVTYIS